MEVGPCDRRGLLSYCSQTDDDDDDCFKYSKLKTCCNGGSSIRNGLDVRYLRVELNRTVKSE